MQERWREGEKELESRAWRTNTGLRGRSPERRVPDQAPSPTKASPHTPSPEAWCAQGAPTRQEGGYQPFFPSLQPPPRRPRGRSSAGVCVAGAAAACAVRGVGGAGRAASPSRPPAAAARSQAPSSVPPRPGSGTLTYLAGRTLRIEAGHAPLATPGRHLVDPPPPP